MFHVTFAQAGMLLGPVTISIVSIAGAIVNRESPRILRRCVLLAATFALLTVGAPMFWRAHPAISVPAFVAAIAGIVYWATEVYRESLHNTTM